MNISLRWYNILTAGGVFGKPKNVISLLITAIVTYSFFFVVGWTILMVVLAEANGSKSLTLSQYALADWWVAAKFAAIRLLWGMGILAGLIVGCFAWHYSIEYGGKLLVKLIPCARINITDKK